MLTDTYWLTEFFEIQASKNDYSAKKVLYH